MINRRITIFPCSAVQTPWRVVHAKAIDPQELPTICRYGIHDFFKVLCGLRTFFVFFHHHNVGCKLNHLISVGHRDNPYKFNNVQ